LKVARIPRSFRHDTRATTNSKLHEQRKSLSIHGGITCSRLINLVNRPFINWSEICENLQESNLNDWYYIS